MVKKKEEKSGSGARERLLHAAMDIFGKHGFEAATTRQIAKLAHVNIAAIPYYYQGKEGLYQAVIEYTVSAVSGRIGGLHGTIAGLSFDGEQGRQQALGIFEELVGRLITFVIGSDDAPRVARIILREQLFPTASYERIFEGFMVPMLDSMATLISAVTKETSYRKLRLRATAVVGQVLAFRIARETMVRSLGMEGYEPAEVEEIREVILEHTRHAFKPFL